MPIISKGILKLHRMFKVWSTSSSIAMAIYLDLTTYLIMPLKTKIMNTIKTHSKIITLGVMISITFVIGTAIGMTDNQVFAGGVPNGTVTW